MFFNPNSTYLKVYIFSTKLVFFSFFIIHFRRHHCLFSKILIFLVILFFVSVLDLKLKNHLNNNNNSNSNCCSSSSRKKKKRSRKISSQTNQLKSNNKASAVVIMDTECKSESSTLDLNHHHHHHYHHHHNHHLQSSINSTNSTISSSSASSISSNCSLSSSPQQHTNHLLHSLKNETLYMSSLSEASSPSVSSISSKHIDENCDQISHLSQSCQNINYLDSSMSDDMDGNGGHYGQMDQGQENENENEIENEIENENEMANNISLSNRTNRFFPDDVVDILNRWFFENQDYPYPDEHMTNVLAKEANISAKQVRKWFANKRVRSNKCYKQSLRLKKDKKSNGMMNNTNVNRKQSVTLIY